ncbi:GIY-YIG nuclease family protein [Pectobacterium brasiliense]|uniref:GIY-YIG nuclease family protein n=1 Tax=Pectobacterium brasiliense TaxID=180957 RepID=UPI001968B5B5|nr:GIY-YIG nuclease family protein [Pectobacterium brasiliense]MBN3114264.1 GIY-YIG nuclease family protein [Pectobacterium brasiliense]
MTGKTINLDFDGYWPEENKSSVPSQSGIYCVYACTYNPNEKPPTVSLRELIYIGESADVRHRIATHNKLNDWNRHLNKGETLCYSVATTPPLDRVRVESALIHEVTPPENKEYSGDFKGNKTTVTTSGENKFLPSSFTAEIE